MTAVWSCLLVLAGSPEPLKYSERIVATLPAGSGEGQVGIRIGSEGSRAGPEGITVAPDGSPNVIDTLNRRMVVLGERQPMPARPQLLGASKKVGKSSAEVRVCLQGDGDCAAPVSTLTVAVEGKIGATRFLSADAAGRFYVFVEKLVSLAPVRVERDVRVLDAGGAEVGRIALPPPSALPVPHEVDVGPDGTVYHVEIRNDSAVVRRYTPATEAAP